MLTLNITKDELIALLGEDMAIALLDYAVEGTAEGEGEPAETVTKEEYDTLATQYSELKTKYIDRFFSGTEEPPAEEKETESEETPADEIGVDDLFEESK